MASKEPPRFPPGPGVKALNKAALALIDVIQRSPLSEIPVLEQQVFNDIFASGEPPSMADVLSFLVPAQDLETAPLDFIPGSLFGLGRRARRGPFFHGTKENNLESILDEGFITGDSAELNLPGTSVTRDPVVAQEMFAENELADLVLGVDIPDQALKEIRNLSPSEFLRSAEILEDMGVKNFPTGVSKPGVFFRESESFFPRAETPTLEELIPGQVTRGSRPSGPASQLKPREMSPDEVLLQEFQDVVEQGKARKRPERLMSSQRLSDLGVSEARVAKDLAAQLRGPRSQVDRNVGRAIEMLDELNPGKLKQTMSGRLNLDNVDAMRQRLDLVERQFREVQRMGRVADLVNSEVGRHRRLANTTIKDVLDNSKVTLVKPTKNILGESTEFFEIEILMGSKKSVSPSDEVKRFSISLKDEFVEGANLKVGATLRDALDAVREPTTTVTRDAQQELQRIIKQLETGRLAPPTSENLEAVARQFR